jgi:hypothetical protein
LAQVKAAPLQAVTPQSILEDEHEFPHPLVTPPLLVKLFQIMGGYKGRTNVRHRKRRSAKAERIKAISAKKEDAKKTA